MEIRSSISSCSGVFSYYEFAVVCFGYSRPNLTSLSGYVMTTFDTSLSSIIPSSLRNLFSSCLIQNGDDLVVIFDVLLEYFTWFIRSSLFDDTLAYSITFLFLIIPINLSTSSSLNLNFPVGSTIGLMYPFFT
ncbi:trichohyalin [Saccharolobus solfataricus]|uniref:Trichohyalin n=1 Tax=Saccharolobus solfataricus TaxID=2287 RepID=Q9UXM1_SACSO|nr:trichohyalin [Saccharolobus solfataricus P2]SAI84434.1 trichohyalin [Saccharolobus solfataricus]